MALNVSPLGLWLYKAFTLVLFIFLVYTC